MNRVFLRPVLLAKIIGVRLEHGLFAIQGGGIDETNETVALTHEAAITLAQEILRLAHKNNIACMAEHRRSAG